MSEDEEDKEEIKQVGTTMVDVGDLQKALDQKSKSDSKHRLEVKELKAIVSQLQPLADKATKQDQADMSEIERLTSQLDAAKLATDQANTIARDAQIRTLATRVGLDDDVVAMIKTDGFDLDNPDAVMESLKKLVVPSRPSSNNIGNPEKQTGNAITKEAFKNMSVEERLTAIDKDPQLMSKLS